MAGYFELKRAPSGHFEFHLRAGNHEVILSSPWHQAHHEALEGIELVRRHARDPDRYERRISRDQSPYFALTAPDGAVIAKSEMYSSAAAMETGIRSVMANGAATQVKGLDRLAGAVDRVRPQPRVGGGLGRCAR
jgi:uncharacterized protein YegP (UPF0339 family)